jgi:hypothetical protein
MFWVTAAGAVAVVAYTSVAAWQGYLMSNQLGVMQSQLGEMKRDYEPFKNSADAAKKAADAAVSAVDISRAQIRAYFACSLLARLESDSKQTVRYTCKNTGQSHARKVTVTITFGYIDLVHGNIVRMSPPGVYYIGDLSPGDSDSRDGTFPISLPKAIVTESHHGGHHVNCTVEFTDIFEVRHAQEFEGWERL